MLVGLAGLISGYRGDYDFPSGSTYPENINYVGMRMILSLFGVVAVPLLYLTCIELRFARAFAFMAATMLLLDNGVIGISRLILLDSMLIFFTILTVFFLTAFNNSK